MSIYLYLYRSIYQFASEDVFLHLVLDCEGAECFRRGGGDLDQGGGGHGRPRGLALLEAPPGEGACAAG